MYQISFGINYSVTVFILLATDALLVWRLARAKGFTKGNSWMVVLFAAAAVFGLSDIACVKLAPEAGKIVNYIANAVYCFSFAFVCFLVFRQQETMAGAKTFLRPVSQVLAYAPLAVLFVALVASYWNGLVFWVDDNGMYTRGPLYLPAVFILGGGYAALAIIHALVRWVKNYNAETHARCHRTLGYCLPILAGVALQALINAIPAADMGITFAVVIAYLHCQDDLIKQNEQASSKYEMVLEGLARDFNAVYYADLKHDYIEVVKHNRANNGTKYDERMMVFHAGYDEVNHLYCEGAIVPADREAYLEFSARDALMTALREEERVSYRYRIIPNQQGQKNIEFQVARLGETDTTFEVVMGYRGIDELIASERRYQEQLEASLEKARVASLGKTNFLRRMSHDLRTPINGIMGMVDIADHFPDDMQKQAECRQKIREASGYLYSLINDVLDMNKLESSTMELENEVANLRDLFQEQTAAAKVSAAENDVEFIDETDYEHMPYPWALCSPQHIRHTVGNIVGNAVKYNVKGGKVFAKALEVPGEGDDFTLRITVEDTGIGMSSEYLKRAFEPFTQENRDEARTKYASTGLGLSLVKELVDLMGGTVSVESEVGKGTKFTVELPLKGAPAPEGANDQAIVAGSGAVSGMHVLLVEDNDLNMEIAQFMLENEGIVVDKAWNGQEAVDAISASEPGTYDAVLMDVMMPVMDGLEAARTIRALDRSDAATLPIFAMTANAFTDDVARSRDAGMNGHITKPLELEKLLKSLVGCR